MRRMAAAFGGVVAAVVCHPELPYGYGGSREAGQKRTNNNPLVIANIPIWVGDLQNCGCMLNSKGYTGNRGIKVRPRGEVDRDKL